MNTVPLCLCHECSKDCHLPDCQLLAYVRELERDKARLDWLLSESGSLAYYWAMEHGEQPNRASIDSKMGHNKAAMQAMKGKCPKCGEVLTCKSVIGYDNHNREQEADWDECPKCGFTQS